MSALRFASVVLALALATSAWALHPALLRGEWIRSDELTATLASDKAAVTHKVWFSLKQNNLQTLERLFWEVSNPKSPLYANYMTQAEITALVAPAPQVQHLVSEWLQAQGALKVDFTVNRDALIAHFTLDALERAFGVAMHAYEPGPAVRTGLGARLLWRSATDPILPPHLQEHIQLVHGISDFPPVTKRTASRIARIAAAARASAQLTPGTPNILRARGREGQIQITFQPVCLDGTLSTALPACSEKPQGATSVQLQVATTINPVPATYNTPVLPSTAPTCQLVQGYAQCTVMVKAPYYDAYTAAVTQIFENAQTFTAQNEHVVANIPPVTPQKLWALYGMGTHPHSTTNVTQCVVEFEQQYYSDADLQLFFQEMGLDSSAPVTVIGPNDQTNPGGEAALDIEWIMGLAPGVPTVFWSIAANSSEEIDDILTWAYAIGNMTNPPLVNSLSYGMAEGNVEYYLGHGYVARSDAEFQKLALQGLTIIIADGDTGSGDLGGPPMGFSDCKTLHPDWPSQSPYVTAVGSTYITPNAQPICYPTANGLAPIDCSQGPDGEVGVALNFGIHWTTGGGFSNFQFTAPYQGREVEQYLATPNALPPASMFNATGRGYPDLVSCGHNLMTVVGGAWDSIDGTSASAPIFAGMVSMWNDKRVAAGKAPLGFLNQVLYDLAASVPESFTDIVIGDNHCGGEGDQCCASGYKAAVGWDAVTGLGSPQWSVIAEQILQLP